MWCVRDMLQQNASVECKKSEVVKGEVVNIEDETYHDEVLVSSQDLSSFLPFEVVQLKRVFCNF